MFEGSPKEERPDSSDDEADYEIVSLSLRQAIEEDKLDLSHSYDARDSLLSSSVSTSLGSGGHDDGDSQQNRSDIDSFRSLVEVDYTKATPSLSMMDFDSDPSQFDDFSDDLKRPRKKPSFGRSLDGQSNLMEGGRVALKV